MGGILHRGQRPSRLEAPPSCLPQDDAGTAVEARDRNAVPYLGDPALRLSAQGRLQGRSIKTYRTNISMLLNFVVDQGGLARSPLQRMPRIPIERRIKFLGEGDCFLLERWCETATDLKLAAFTMIALHAGLRRTEILTLQRGEIELEGRHPSIHVLAGKSKSRRERTVGMSQKLRAFLAERMPKLPQRDPFMFQGVDERFARMVAQCGLKVRATPHVLRHTLATRLVSRGVPINLVQEMLGHADLQTSSIYIHAAAKDVLEAPLALDLPMQKPIFDVLKR